MLNYIKWCILNLFEFEVGRNDMNNIKVFQNFGILNRVFMNYLSKLLVEKNITFSDSIILMNISDDEGINQESLAHLLVIDKAAVTRSVKNLEQNEYIRTEKSLKDKRSKKLYLTEQGKQLSLLIKDKNSDWLNIVFKGINQTDIDIFMKCLLQVQKNSEKERYFHFILKNNT